MWLSAAARVAAAPRAWTEPIPSVQRGVLEALDRRQARPPLGSYTCLRCEVQGHRGPNDPPGCWCCDQTDRLTA